MTDPKQINNKIDENNEKLLHSGPKNCKKQLLHHELD